MTKTITTSEARKKFSQITDEVEFTGITYLVLKNGKPSVKIMPQSAQAGVSPAFKKNVSRVMRRFDYDLKKLAKS